MQIYTRKTLQFSFANPSRSLFRHRARHQRRRRRQARARDMLSSSILIYVVLFKLFPAVGRRTSGKYSNVRIRTREQTLEHTRESTTEIAGCNMPQLNRQRRGTARPPLLHINILSFACTLYTYAKILDARAPHTHMKK